MRRRILTLGSHSLVLVDGIESRTVDGLGPFSLVEVREREITNKLGQEEEEEESDERSGLMLEAKVTD